MTDFHRLYVQYAPLVRRLALLLSGNPALADDITSETFVRAWTTAGPLGEETVKAYLFTIARNLYQDSLRRSRRDAALDESLPATDAAADTRAEAREELRRVLSAIGDLPAIDRSALLMRVREDMPYGDIARALGLSVTAVKVKVHRARRRLMQATGHPHGNIRTLGEER
jgi:RNA polymerase sigma-70 factor (ECF subfamily)